MSEEVWKDIKGYEGIYQVSNLLRFRSLDREVVDSIGRVQHRKGKVLSVNTGRNNLFAYHSLHKPPEKPQNVSAAVVAFETFVGKVPAGKFPMLIDESKGLDVTNLKLASKGVVTRNPEVAIKAIHLETGIVQRFESLSEAARGINGFVTAVHMCLDPKKYNKTYKGYRFEYAD